MGHVLRAGGLRFVEQLNQHSTQTLARLQKSGVVRRSMEQYEWLKEAIANWRRVQETLRKMRRLSRAELFESLPNPKRRKRLGKKVLGLV